MHYAIICDDKPDSLKLRLDVRPAHVAYLNGLGGKLAFAGPFLDAAANPCGSLVVVDVADRAAAEAIAAQDPYALASLFASVEIRAWRWALKAPVA